MRLLPWLRAFAALPSLILTPPALGAPGREWIVHLARRPLGVSAAAEAARLASLLEAWSVAPLRRFDAGLSLAGGSSGTGAGPFDLDPSRYVLVTADSAAAEAAREALMADPGVVWVEPNAVRKPAALPPGFPSDPLFVDTRQWGLMNRGPAGAYGGIAGADIHAPEAWALSVGSTTVRLAIADTGVDPAHPELQAPMPDGGLRVAFGANVTADPNPAWADSFGHGTTVAGVMAARSHEGARFDSLGMAGVCGGDGAGNPGCRLVPIKIAPGRTGTASSFDIARAMLHATSMGARAMNLSFAGSGPSRLERLAMLHAITHGCVVVAAAGNLGFTDGARPQYPGAYAADGLGIQVGASDPWDRRPVWSSHGPGLDVVAPGLDIWTCRMTHSPLAPYVAASGTSFAAPFATGTIGLLAAARPDLTDTDFQQVLRATADDVGAAGRDDETGWGRLNAAAALRAVDASLGLWHDEVAGARFTSAGFDTLILGEPGPGALERVIGPVRVERIEVTATVSLPDSFTGPVRVWPRVGGTFTGRGASRMPYWTPWAEVVAQEARAFTLRGYLFRVAGPCAACGGESWLPLPFDQARFGFTVLGPVERGPAQSTPARAPAAPRLAVHPNPFRTTTLVSGPPGSPVTILDAAGRVVRRGVLDGTMGRLVWDGLDGSGRSVRPGLYLVRCDRPDGTHFAKVVRLE